MPKWLWVGGWSWLVLSNVLYLCSAVFISFLLKDRVETLIIGVAFVLNAAVEKTYNSISVQISKLMMANAVLTHDIKRLLSDPNIEAEGADLVRAKKLMKDSSNMPYTRTTVHGIVALYWMYQIVRVLLAPTP